MWDCEAILLTITLNLHHLLYTLRAYLYLIGVYACYLGDTSSCLLKTWTCNWCKSDLVGENPHDCVLASLLSCRKGEFALSQKYPCFVFQTFVSTAEDDF